MPEGKLFECPSCGAPLTPSGDEAKIKCPYCGSTVIVPEELRPPDPGIAQGANPITIITGDTGLALQPAVDLSPATSRWIKTGIWAFVVLMVISVVVPLVCSFCGVGAGLAGSVVPFLVR